MTKNYFWGTIENTVQGLADYVEDTVEEFNKVFLINQTNKKNGTTNIKPK